MDRAADSIARTWSLSLAAVAALGLGGWIAIRHPSPIVASLSFTGAWAILIGAVGLARYGLRPAFWAGFALFGWIYAALAFAPGAWSEVRPYLLTSRLLDAVHDGLKLQDWPVNPFDPGRFPDPSDAGLAPWNASEPGRRYQRIGHAFAAIGHAVAGGLWGDWLARRRDRAPRRSGPPTLSSVS